MVVLEDFEVCQCVGHRRTDSLGEGDVVRVVYLSSGETLAMKRVEVGAKSGMADDVMRELTRGAGLQPHPGWLRLRKELCFSQEFVDGRNRKRVRCCIVEELADISLEQDLVSRAANGQSYGDIFGLFAAALHGVQAFHAQGFLHGGICPRNVFFKEGEVKLGTPGPSGAKAPSVYPGGECAAYSADIFALGLVFLEMAVLAPASDLVAGGPSAALDELKVHGTGAPAVRAWLEERCALLGVELPHRDVIELLGAMLAADPASRPTADDLLDWPQFAAHADPMQLLPVARRPCVVLAHRAGVALNDAPRRDVLAMPGCHQIFSREGAAEALQARRYNWCGRDFDLWWVQAGEPPPVLDLTDASSLSDDVPPEVYDDASAQRKTAPPLPPLRSAAAFAFARKRGEAAADTLFGAAVASEGRSCLLQAETMYRAVLISCGTVERRFDVWQRLVAVMFARGNIMGARRTFDHARQLQLHLHSGEEASGGGGVVGEAGPPTAAQLLGFGEVFAAVEAMEGVCARRGEAAVPSSGPKGSPEDRAATLRAVHVQLYLRAAIATEASLWEVLAGLGEFYRLVGSPAPALTRPEPDASTALCYFRHVQAVAPGSPFVLDRIARLEPLADGSGETRCGAEQEQDR